MRKILITLTATALAAAPLAGAEAATKKYKVSVAVSPKLIDVAPNHDDRFTISGKVSNGPVKGRSVRITAINQRDGGRSVDIGWKRLTSSGSYKTSWHPPRGGLWTFKVTKSAVGSVAAGSNARSADAFDWPLIKVFPRAIAGDAQETTDERVDGSRYGFADSQFVLHGGSSIRFNTMGYKCKKLTLHVGIADSSRVSSAKYEVAQVGRKTVRHTIGRKRETLKIDPLDPNRTVLLTAVGSADARVLVGNMKVFCTYPYNR